MFGYLTNPKDHVMMIRKPAPRNIISVQGGRLNLSGCPCGDNIDLGGMRFCLPTLDEAGTFILAKMHTHSDVGGQPTSEKVASCI